MGSLKVGCALWTLGGAPDVDTLRRHMDTQKADNESGQDHRCGDHRSRWYRCPKSPSGDRRSTRYAGDTSLWRDGAAAGDVVRAIFGAPVLFGGGI
jgi:hypothetical protein